jgi:hypothetical protein
MSDKTFGVKVSEELYDKQIFVEKNRKVLLQAH